MELLNYLYAVLIVLNIFLAAAIIFFERRDVNATWTWLMVLLFLPVLGFILYLLLGRKLNKRKLYRLKNEEMLALEKLIQHQRDQLKQGEINYKDPLVRNYQNIIHLNLMNSTALFTQDNNVEIYTNGQAKFASLKECIKNAKHHVHLLYYIVRNDRLGKEIIQLLSAKAKEGVQVRLLYDHIGSLGIKKILPPLLDAGGEAAAFFPSKIPYLNIRLNYRNHRKLVIIDGKIGFIGGFNIGSEYLGLNKRLGSWRDTHIKVTGSAVHEMQIRFILDWNLAAARKINYYSDYFPQIAGQGRVGVQIISSGPDSEREQIKNCYLTMIYAAKESIYIQTPYFVPDETLMTALKTAAMSGVDVRIMIPANPDYQFVYWASYAYIGDLLKFGIRCYLYQAGFIHAKTIVVDGKIASVGTANFDVRSFRYNFEVNALIYDTKTAANLKEIFLKDIEKSSEMTWTDYNKRPVVSKIRESVVRLLAPIL